MNKILVIFTGGTIGSISNDGIINVKQNEKNYKLISLYKEHCNSTCPVEFKTIEPLNILSENLNPSAWITIIKSIESEDLSQYNGIIITHGTDTLAYSSSLFSAYFNNLNIPLILVSSDFTLDKENANGLINFDIAIKFIETFNKKGVFVSYKNVGETPKIHFGAKLSTSLQLDCYFTSYKNKPFMEYIGNTFITIDSSLPKIENNTYSQPIFSDRILLIKPYPGLNYDFFNLDNIDIIVHELFHSGTACTTSQWGDEHSLIPFLKKCQDKNIKVFLAPIESNDEVYQSTEELIDAGAEFLFDQTIESAYAQTLLSHINK